MGWSGGGVSVYLFALPSVPLYLRLLHISQHDYYIYPNTTTIYIPARQVDSVSDQPSYDNA